mgnify:CR=1 FL=1
MIIIRPTPESCTRHQEMMASMVRWDLAKEMLVKGTVTEPRQGVQVKAKARSRKGITSKFRVEKVKVGHAGGNPFLLVCTSFSI